jgi:hypothetical protein
MLRIIADCLLFIVISPSPQVKSELTAGLLSQILYMPIPIDTAMLRIIADCLLFIVITPQEKSELTAGLLSQVHAYPNRHNHVKDHS